MATTDQRIDAIAITRRRAVVASILRKRYAGVHDTLPGYVADAAAILTALDEMDSFGQNDPHETVAAALTQQQEIRNLAVTHAIIALDTAWSREMFSCAEEIAAYIETGQVPA